MAQVKKSMAQLLEEVENAKPVIEVNGRPIYRENDAVALTEYEVDQQLTGREEIDISHRIVNSDGSYARGNYKNVIMPNGLFENRYRKDGKFINVVTDFRAIQDQASGKIYTDNIVVHVIGRGAGGRPVYKHSDVIDSKTFIKDYKRKLSDEAMQTLFSIIQDRPVVANEGDDLSFGED